MPIEPPIPPIGFPSRPIGQEENQQEEENND